MSQSTPSPPSPASSPLHLDLPPPNDPETGEPRSICPTCSAPLASPSARNQNITEFHHPKKLKRYGRAIADSKVGRAIYWPFKPRPRFKTH
ncbi:hypothetical protein JCM10207_005920 [Rhodosporidiobolus poonsookiae]